MARRKSQRPFRLAGLAVLVSASCSQVLGLGDFEDAPPGGDSGESGMGPDDGGAENGGTAGGGATGTGGSVGGASTGGASGSGKGGNAGTTSGSGGEGGLPDPGDHCCWNCDGAECVIEAADDDSDTFGSRDCAEAPGTDCDDSAEAVNPDAGEACNDSLDNNCDDIIDILPDIVFESPASAIPNRHAVAVTWNPQGSEFGLIGNSDMNGIYFTMTSVDGTVNTGTMSIIPTNSTTSYFGARIAWGPDSLAYGVVYSAGNQGGAFTDYIQVSEAGEGQGSYALPQGQNGDIEARANGDFLIVHAGADSALHVGTVVQGAGYVDRTSRQEIATLPRIATNGDAAAVVWTVRDTTSVEWARVTSSVVLLEPVGLSQVGVGPDVAKVGTSYALGWIEASRVMFEIARSDGTIVCGPTPIPFGDNVLDPEDAVALLTTANDTLVLAADHSGSHLSLIRVDGACRVTSQAPVKEPVPSAGSPSLAVGNGDVLVTWDEVAGGLAAGQHRFVSELGCP